MVTFALLDWFWDVFWLLVIFIPVTVLWIFSVIDVFRRPELPGLLRAVWLLVIFFLPILGPLIYVAFRPSGINVSPEFAHYLETSRVDQLHTLAEMRDSGRLTEGEYLAEKQRLLGGDTRDQAIRTVATGGV